MSSEILGSFVKCDGLWPSRQGLVNEGRDLSGYDRFAFKFLI